MQTAHDSLSLLKCRIASIGQPKVVGQAGQVGTGHEGIDAALAGGLSRGCLHEIFAAEPGDAGCATGFSAALALLLKGGIVWLREEAAERQGGNLHAAGLVEIGVDPAQLIMAVLPDPLSVLRAAADVVRCPELGVVIIELWRNPRVMDLTASRRLVLGAEASGVTAIMLRIAAEPEASAAQTRWRVGAAASVPLEANAPGHPAWEIELLRQRGRPAGGVWHVEWDRDRTKFREERAGHAALSGLVFPLSADRSPDADSVIPRRRA